MPQDGQPWVPGLAALCCERRLVLRLWDCFCLGTAMAGEGYSTTGSYGSRPVLPSDADAMARLSLAAFGPGDDRDLEVVVRRARHLIDGCDPSSCVAELPTGELIGLALTRRLGPIVLLAWAAVLPRWQGRGVGRALLASFPAAAAGCNRVILSSPDPKAMRRYHALGLSLHPTVSAGGILRPGAVAAVPQARECSPLQAAEVLDALGQAARGAPFGRDLQLLEAQGDRVHLCGDGAAVVRGGPIIRLAVARDRESARLALRAALAAVPPGQTVHLNQLRAGMDWAIDEAMAAGLALSPEGPLFADAPLHPLHLPQGALG